MKITKKRFFLTVFLSYFLVNHVALADIDVNGDILANSPIRASDINTKFEQLNTALLAKGLPEREFIEVSVGDPISKQHIINNLALVTEVQVSVSLGTELISFELNSLFDSVLSAINSYSYVVELTDWGACSVDSQPCSGTGQQYQNWTCSFVVNGNVVSTGLSSSLCNPIEIPSVDCYSQEGNLNEIISGGEKVVFCEEGSTDKTLISLTCSEGYSEDNGSCVEELVSYSYMYSDWGLEGCTVESLVSCEGTSIIEDSRDATCIQYINGENNGAVQGELCGNSEEVFREFICLSVAGTKLESISNGTKEYTCNEGQHFSVAEYIIDCDEGYTLDNDLCVIDAEQDTLTISNVYFSHSELVKEEKTNEVQYSNTMFSGTAILEMVDLNSITVQYAILESCTNDLSLVQMQGAMSGVPSIIEFNGENHLLLNNYINPTQEGSCIVFKLTIDHQDYFISSSNYSFSINENISLFDDGELLVYKVPLSSDEDDGDISNVYYTDFISKYFFEQDTGQSFVFSEDISNFGIKSISFSVKSIDDDLTPLDLFGFDSLLSEFGLIPNMSFKQEGDSLFYYTIIKDYQSPQVGYDYLPFVVKNSIGWHVFEVTVIDSANYIRTYLGYDNIFFVGDEEDPRSDFSNMNNTWNYANFQMDEDFFIPNLTAKISPSDNYRAMDSNKIPENNWQEFHISHSHNTITSHKNDILTLFMDEFDDSAESITGMTGWLYYEVASVSSGAQVVKESPIAIASCGINCNIRLVPNQNFTGTVNITLNAYFLPNKEKEPFVYYDWLTESGTPFLEEAHFIKQKNITWNIIEPPVADNLISRIRFDFTTNNSENSWYNFVSFHKDLETLLEHDLDHNTLYSCGISNSVKEVVFTNNSNDFSFSGSHSAHCNVLYKESEFVLYTLLTRGSDKVILPVDVKIEPFDSCEDYVNHFQTIGMSSHVENIIANSKSPYGACDCSSGYIWYQDSCVDRYNLPWGVLSKFWMD